MQLFVFRPQAARVQRTLEPVGVALRDWKPAGADGGQRGLDVEQAFPDLRFPLRNHPPSGLDGRLNLLRAGVGSVLAGIPGRKVLAGIPGRKVLTGDGRVAQRLALERACRLVRTRGAATGEIGVDEARRRAVVLPARRDAGAVSPRGLRKRRLVLLSARRRSSAPGCRDQEAEDENRRRLKP